MSKHRSTRFGRRATLGLLGAGLAAPFIRPAAAQAAWPEPRPRSPTHPEGLRRGAHRGPSAAPCTMRRSRPHYEPFEKISGHQGARLPRLRSDQDQGDGRDRQRRMGPGPAQPRLDHEPAEARRLFREDRLRHRRSRRRSRLSLRVRRWRCWCGRRCWPIATTPVKGDAPKGWADFWDTRKFPGERAMVGTSAGGFPELEFALMAAGVPPDKRLSDRHRQGLWRATTRSRRDVIKWWDTGAVPIQLLTDREVTMTTVWNGRMAALAGGRRACAAISLEPGPARSVTPGASPRAPRTRPTR